MDVAHIPSETILESFGDKKIKAQDFMKCGVITVKKNIPVYQAIATLIDRNITGLPVVDDNMHVEGIISEKDVLSLLYEKGRGNGYVEQFMTPNVVSFDSNACFEEICSCLADSCFRRVAILNQDKLVSVITRSDIIRVARKWLIVRPANPGNVQKVSLGRLSMAGTVMSRGLVTIKRDASFSQIVYALADNDITGLPVVTDDMRLEGIISEKDVIRLLRQPGCDTAKAEDIMTRDVTTFRPEHSLLDICLCLLNKNFRRVPIINNGKLVGIVSRRDIIIHILKHQLHSIKPVPVVA